METQVRTPQMIFMQPQRLIVPLFQRPYVWNQENQWEPLWNDVVRVTERLIGHPQGPHYPHFLGAVVLQQVQNPTGSMQERTIIDGQQRLTTLQILLDALHAELHAVGATQQAMRVEALVTNQEPFWERPEDRFKVWPTNRDRAAFNAVMEAEPPVAYDTLAHRGTRMVQAHRFFSEQARQWLVSNGAEKSLTRGAAIERAVRDLLQVVVIDLTADENAQEIFETLNARGAQLTAADLIKNFIFQRLIEAGVDVEAAYERFWKNFETGFWETEINVGRLRYPRSSIFLNHWLIASTGEEVVAREVFSRFKSYADFDAGVPMGGLLERIHRAAKVYRQFVTSASMQSGPTDRVGLFGYRTGVLESEVIKPLIILLLDPEGPQVPENQVNKTLDVVESWMVRRMLVRATTKPYAQIVADLVTHLRKGDRQRCGDITERFLAEQKGVSRYWPDDDELRVELRPLLAYRRLGRSRLRMVLEAVEDFQRGWKDGQPGLGGERVARGTYAIEHVMPRKWTTHWPLANGVNSEERDRIIHVLGNLTLLTSKLNSKVSHGPWGGVGGKREALQKHDVLLMNRDLLKRAESAWTDEAIRSRTEELTKIIIKIWPVPEGHRAGFSSQKARPHRRLDLGDLINAGSLEPGMTLYPRRKRFADRIATLLPDGRVDVDGETFSAPSPAAVSITGKATNGWWFFLVDQSARRSLKDVLRDYVETLAVDVDDDDADDDAEDEESS